MKPLCREDPRSAGPYQLLGLLGAGGMGRVYLGRSPGGRNVAVKVIRPEFASDPTFHARFRREVEAARRVGGRWTAQVIDADPAAEQPYLVTAYVPGPSLSAAVHRHGPLPPRTLLALGVGLAEALVAVHAAGVVHRDLKPSNVLLTLDGPTVIDFGIARAVDSSSSLLSGLDEALGLPPGQGAPGGDSASSGVAAGAARPGTLPAGYVGTWEGRVVSRLGVVQDVVITLRAGASGQTVGDATFTLVGLNGLEGLGTASVRCVGDVELVGLTDPADAAAGTTVAGVVLRDVPGSGENPTLLPGVPVCTSGGTSRLAMAADGTLTYLSEEEAAGRPTGPLRRRG